jgi:hypothetical protein
MVRENETPESQVVLPAPQLWADLTVDALRRSVYSTHQTNPNHRPRELAPSLACRRVASARRRGPPVRRDLVLVEQIGGRKDKDLAHHLLEALTHQLLELDPLLNDRRAAAAFERKIKYVTT